MEESNKEIRKKIFENIMVAIAVMLYFIIMNFVYIRTNVDLVLKSTKIISLIILFLSIITFEIAYRKDSGRIALYGVEILFLSINTLILWNIIYKYNIEFMTYIGFSSLIFIIYYIIKSMIIYTKEKRRFLDSLSDIHEIVQSEPTKKEAKKRNN